MLGITRKSGEKLYVGDNVVIHFTSVSGGKARLAIEAPKDVRILRDDAINKEAKQEEVK